MTRPTPFRPRRGIVPALAMVAALTLAGCSGSADDDTSATPTPTETTSPAPAVTAPSVEPEEPRDAPVEDEPSSEPTAGEDDASGEGSGDAGEALSTYVEREREQLERLSESLGGVYSDITIEAQPPGGITYTYVYAEQVPADTTAESLDDFAPSYEEQLDGAVFPLMEQQGVPSPRSVTYTYLNADGAEIWTRTFTED